MYTKGGYKVVCFGGPHLEDRSWKRKSAYQNSIFGPAGSAKYFCCALFRNETCDFGIKPRLSNLQPWPKPGVKINVLASHAP
jgi:hypothetical protein